MELTRLNRTSPSNRKAHTRVRKKVHLALVDQNYCTYYPVDQVYRPLRDWRQSGANVNNILASLHGTAAQLWKLVEKCTETGQLEQLRNGQFEENEALERAERVNGISDDDPHGGQPSFLDVTDGAGDPRPQHRGDMGAPNTHHQPSFRIKGGASHTNPQDEDEGNIQSPSDSHISTRSSSMGSDRVMTNIHQDEVASASESGEVL